MSEFGLCVQFGPGEAGCQTELAQGIGPLAQVCEAGCAMGTAPPPAPASRCSPGCENEFELCVQYGPGYAGCVTERDAGVGPLAAFCEVGCIETIAMAALASGATPPECSAACASEFGVCTQFGPGYGGCSLELQSGSGPLGTVCTANCSMTAAMLALDSG